MNNNYKAYLEHKRLEDVDVDINTVQLLKDFDYLHAYSKRSNPTEIILVERDRRTALLTNITFIRELCEYLFITSGDNLYSLKEFSGSIPNFKDFVILDTNPGIVLEAEDKTKFNLPTMAIRTLSMLGPEEDVVREYPPSPLREGALSKDVKETLEVVKKAIGVTFAREFMTPRHLLAEVSMIAPGGDLYVLKDPNGVLGHSITKYAYVVNRVVFVVSDRIGVYDLQYLDEDFMEIANKNFKLDFVPAIMTTEVNKIVAEKRTKKEESTLASSNIFGTKEVK
ncbi:hypothetical protein [Lysinibacillus xylanilyticus]|uniref:hypothetical protein n=1 Tax=Lysinibacillus xylanilyticus TaxID=582475 RepID=UPI0036D7E243